MVLCLNVFLIDISLSPDMSHSTCILVLGTNASFLRALHRLYYSQNVCTDGAGDLP